MNEMTAAPRRFAAKAVLFDLDGTLVDSIPDLAEAATRMMAELGLPPRSRDEITRFVGKGLAELVRRCISGAQPPSAEELATALEVFKRHYAATNGSRSTVYDGVAETLAVLRARGLPLAVVTNKAHDFTVPLLAAMELEGYFAAVISGDTTAHKKPHPAPLREACARLGVAPEAALMIGDSANDSLAARAAGMAVLLVDYGYSEGLPVDTIECDGLLSSVRQLPDWLA